MPALGSSTQELQEAWPVCKLLRTPRPARQFCLFTINDTRLGIWPRCDHRFGAGVLQGGDPRDISPPWMTRASGFCDDTPLLVIILPGDEWSAGAV